MASTEELKARADTLETAINTVLVLSFGLVVMLMQAGFALLEAGSVRAKNTTNIILKNVMDSWMAAIVYWGVGWGFAYGEPSNAFIGHNYFFGSNIQNNFDGVNTSYTDKWAADGYYVSWFFQYVFAATTATIVSGAMAERCEFKAYLGYCTVLTAFVYPVAAHWSWSSKGWLLNGPNGLFFQDFAGSGTVHMLSGTAALVGSYMLGPRIGRFDSEGNPIDMPGHSVPIASLGAFILFMGFPAFNGGSLLSITGPGQSATVSLIFVNTILAGSSGAIVGLSVFKFYSHARGRHSYWSLLITINAALTGMVTTCSGCNDIYPWTAVVFGVIGGFAYLQWHYMMLWMKIDDPLDAVAVHLGGGIVGVLLAPIFAIKGQYHEGVPVGGIIYGGHWKAFQGFGWNLLSATVITAWTLFWSFLLFGSMKYFNILRVPREIELAGLDIAKHNEAAYPIKSYQGFLSDKHIGITTPEDARQRSEGSDNPAVDFNGV